jgi:hypothetical protein
LAEVVAFCWIVHNKDNLKTIQCNTTATYTMKASFKNGVKCLRCSKILFDKSNFNRHHQQVHKQLTPMFESNVCYKADKDVVISEFEWSLVPLIQASEANADVAPGLLERETKILSRGKSLFPDSKIYISVTNPSVELRDSAEALIDKIDDFVGSSSTLARSHIMRSKNNALKAVPFQPLKDSTGYAYAMTLARFVAFAEIYFNEDASIETFVEKALMEECNTDTCCCMEQFLLCMSQHAPNLQNADALQHSAMHMRRVLRGVALMKMTDMSGSEVENFCEAYLNPKKAAPFGVLTSMYYEIKRCVPIDKRLLIHRTEPDDGSPAGSAVLVLNCIWMSPTCITGMQTG